MNPIQPLSPQSRRPDEERSFGSWTERAARYHRSEHPLAPRGVAPDQRPTA